MGPEGWMINDVACEGESVVCMARSSAVHRRLGLLLEVLESPEYTKVRTSKMSISILPQYSVRDLLRPILNVDRPE